MKVYAITAICSAAALLAMTLIDLDSRLPLYGFEAERASPAWQFLQLLLDAPALPFLAGVSLFASLVGMVLRSNQPTNQHNQLGNQHNQLARTTQPTRTVDVQIETPESGTVLLLPEPPEPGELSFAIKRAVLTTADCGGDMNAAADKLGKSVAQARREYPDWTNWHVPPKGR
jgi:hypothetical protein